MNKYSIFLGLIIVLAVVGVISLGYFGYSSYKETLAEKEQAGVERGIKEFMAAINSIPAGETRTLFDNSTNLSIICAPLRVESVTN